VWPLAIIGLLVLSAAGNVLLVVTAVGDPSFAVERDYYRKALAWDRTAGQRDRSDALGWSARAQLSAASADQAQLDVWLEDDHGRPLAGARVAVEAFHNARARDVHVATLSPREAGRYVALVPSARRGLWEVRLTAERGGDTFTTVLAPELAAAR
jgi:nitrogen fixation protein FixH